MITEKAKSLALEMLEDGMSLSMIALYTGTTEKQIEKWREEESKYQAKNPVLALMHKGMTCEEIGKELGCTTEAAHTMVVAAWRKDKDRR